MSLSLNVSGLWKSYGGNPVLRGVSFSVNQKGGYVLMGDNGTGKSTFLRLCAMLEMPDTGEVSYFSNGTPLPDNIALRRRLTLVLPGIGVFNKTAYNNVAYGLKIRGLKKHDIDDAVGAALDFVGLRHKKNQNALTLSSGETQRLGIARALVINPEMLFLDEPTAFVDARNREIIEEIILNLKKEGKTTIIISTHDMKQAERLSDRHLMLKDGIISPL